MVFPAAALEAQLLTHQGIAAVSRHQQTGLELVIFQTDAGMAVFHLDPLHPGRGDEVHVIQRLQSGQQARAQVPGGDDLAQGGHAFLLRVQAGEAETALFRDMDVFDGLGLSCHALPYAQGGEDALRASGQGDAPVVVVGHLFHLQGRGFHQAGAQAVAGKGDGQAGAGHAAADDENVVHGIHAAMIASISSMVLGASLDRTS